MRDRVGNTGGGDLKDKWLSKEDGKGLGIAV